MPYLKQYNPITEPGGVPAVLQELERRDDFSLDFETTSLDTNRGAVHGVALATEDREWYVCLGAEKAILPHLGDLFKTKKIYIHNAAFDLHFSNRYGYKPARLFDTMIAQWMVDENQYIGLKELARTKLGVDSDIPDFKSLLHLAKKLLGKKRLDEVSIYDVPLDRLAEYAARDARWTYDLGKLSEAELEREGMAALFYDVEMPYVQVIVDMEASGFWIDQRQMAAVEQAFIAKRDEALSTWCRLSGGANPGSSQQIAGYLYGTLGYPVTLTTERGAPSTDVLALTRLLRSDINGAVKALLDVRKYEKLITTYITAFRDNLYNDRLYGKFNRTGTVTGRLSCVDGDTKIETSAGTFCIRDLNPLVDCEVTGHTGHWCRVTDKIYKGKDHMYHVTLENGSTITVTAEHKFLSESGWRALANISVGDTLLIDPGQDREASEARQVDHHRGGPVQAFVPGTEDDGFGDTGSVPGNGTPLLDYKHVLLQNVLPGRDEGGALGTSQKHNAGKYPWSRDEKEYPSGQTDRTGGRWLHTPENSNNLAGFSSDGAEEPFGVRTSKKYYRSTEPEVVQEPGQAEKSGAVLSRNSRSSAELHLETDSLLREAVHRLLRGSEALLVYPGYAPTCIWSPASIGTEHSWTHLVDHEPGGGGVVSSLAGARNTPYPAVRILYERQEPMGGRLLLPTVEAPGGSGWNISPERARQKAGLREGQFQEKEQPEITSFDGETGDKRYRIGSAVYRGCRVKSIEYAGVRDVWDISVEGDHSYVAQGFINHNSSEPNLQNIPSRGEEGSQIRRLFAARPGHAMLVVDLSQAELRLLAHYSRDRGMMMVFAEDGDPHQMTADILGIARKYAKNVNFGWIYGIGPKGLQDFIEKITGDRPDFKDTKQWLNGFGSVYPGAVAWKNRVIDYVPQLGYIKTLYGRRRRLPDINSFDMSLRSQAERQAVNSIIQGGVADIMTYAMLEISKVLQQYDAKMLAQVHDELVFELPEKAAAEFSPVVKRIMESSNEKFGLRVAQIADPGIGRSWAEAKN